MLVYSSCVQLNPTGGPSQIVREVARWMGGKGKSHVDPVRLESGIKDLILRNGQHVRSQSTVSEGEELSYPMLLCMQFTHPDDKVSGRRWTTEVGVRQDHEGAPIDCTFLLKTDEVSARVVSAIQVTRPKLVADIVDKCMPAPETPGVRVKRLDEDSAIAFLAEVERETRSAPLVVVSPAGGGNYLVSPERMRSIVVGIADVVEVPVGADTYAIEGVVGRRYGAWGGAINLIFPIRKGRVECETVMFRPAQIEDMLSDGRSVESEVLAAITHRTNLPNSWRHISLETVGQARLRSQLERSIRDAGGKEELVEYVQLLELADQELRAKDAEVHALRADLDERESDVRRLEAANDGLKYSLSERQFSLENGDSDESLSLIRGALEQIFEGDIGLHEALTLVGSIYFDRVVVLETAYDSARDSDARGFRYGKRAFDLLWKLATGYWDELANGGGDQQAKNVFGSSYAANESDSISTFGKARRTFSYDGRSVEMFKHLKIGVKDSPAETLRVHFEWFADSQRIVIGHCGKHLDF